MFFQLLQRRFRVVSIVIVLLASIPFALDFFAVPFGIRRSAPIAGNGIAFKFIGLAAGRQKIPTETAIANAGLQEENGSIDGMTDHMTETKFGTDVIFSAEARLQPARLVIASDHRTAHVFAHRPLAFRIYQIGIFFLCFAVILERVICCRFLGFTATSPRPTIFD